MSRIGQPTNFFVVLGHVQHTTYCFALKGFKSHSNDGGENHVNEIDIGDDPAIAVWFPVLGTGVCFWRVGHLFDSTKWVHFQLTKFGDLNFFGASALWTHWYKYKPIDPCDEYKHKWQDDRCQQCGVKHFRGALIAGTAMNWIRMTRNRNDRTHPD